MSTTTTFQPATASIPNAQLHLSLATRQLATLVASGCPVVRSLQVLAEQQEIVAVAEVLNHVSNQVESGQRLSVAFASCPRIFPKVYVSLIQVGEATGKLDACLRQLAQLLERDYRVRRQLKSAFTYPAFVLGVAGVLVLLIFYVILPNFVTIFRDLNMPLPLLTQALMVITESLRSPGCWLFALGSGLLIYQGWQKAWADPQKRVVLFRWGLRLPAFGKILQLATISRFCLVMEVTLSNGLDLLSCLQLAAHSSGSPVLEHDCPRLRDSISQGVSWSSHMALEPNIYPMVVRQVVTAGEESSGIAESLKRLALLLEEELAYRMASLNALIEPVMMMGVGITIGTIALAIMLPLYSFLGKIGT